MHGTLQQGKYDNGNTTQRNPCLRSLLSKGLDVFIVLREGSSVEMLSALGLTPDRGSKKQAGSRGENCGLPLQLGLSITHEVLEL